jgi:hypothetical protein
VHSWQPLELQATISIATAAKQINFRIAITETTLAALG